MEIKDRIEVIEQELGRLKEEISGFFNFKKGDLLFNKTDGTIWIVGQDEVNGSYCLIVLIGRETTVKGTVVRINSLKMDLSIWKKIKGSFINKGDENEK